LALDFFLHFYKKERASGDYFGGFLQARYALLATQPTTLSTGENGV